MAFKLNMTDKEANAKEFEYPPSGEYLCRITDLSLEEVTKAGDNFGKPYWKLSLVVEDGEYAGKTIPTTVMLFDGALISLKMLCEAVHPEYIGSDNQIKLPDLENGMPDPDPWIGQLVHIKGTKYKAGTLRRDRTEREYDEFNVRFRKTKSEGVKAGTGLPLP